MLAPLAPTAIAAPARQVDARAAGTAFEALILERLLAAARPAAQGPAADWRAMADRALAASLSATSPLGLAALIERDA